MKNQVKKIYIALYGLNFIIITFISLTICMTIYKICNDYQARDFLEMARYLPHIAWKVPTISIVLCILLGFSNFLKSTVFSQQQSKIVLLYILDLLIFSLITYTLNFSYKGYFLYICAGLFLQIQGLSIRLIMLVITLGCFTFFDYDLLTVQVNMLPFQEYINYYNLTNQFYLYGIKSLLESANLILVMIFFYMLINSKIRENKEFIQLNNKLKVNIKELNIANEKLEEAGRMKERNRLAHEIHDILGHSLTCISTGLEACMEVAGKSNPGLTKHIYKIKKVSDKGLLDIRRSVRELKSDVIDEASLIKSVKELIEGINSLGKQIATLNIEGEIITMQHDEELTVYRLVQESTTNSIRHGKASRIHIDMTFEKMNLMIRITDDGKGCSFIVKNFGISHMEEQVSMLGGSIRFISDQGSGFITIAHLPLRSETLK
ncbi:MULTISPECIES: sensor histidine kinase [unclassified Oceanispirochaeta]|nr:MULTISPECIES: sensor histidine kinase [unclassified Oceanispirochaeta]MBF9014610.1 sensor histidine kinase [Oceanispirochaeta sp. M2]NPD70866.1 sensor histidine kinase [Oceanispirochaeta sp. M1]RDG34145.1 sensor histidine kinase [Oceanispirochaeta sp. M1]